MQFVIPSHKIIYISLFGCLKKICLCSNCPGLKRGCCFVPLHIIQSCCMLYIVLILSFAYHILKFIWFGSFSLVCGFQFQMLCQYFEFLFGLFSLCVDIFLLYDFNEATLILSARVGCRRCNTF